MRMRMRTVCPPPGHSVKLVRPKPDQPDCLLRPCLYGFIQGDKRVYTRRTSINSRRQIRLPYSLIPCIWSVRTWVKSLDPSLAMVTYSLPHPFPLLSEWHSQWEEVHSLQLQMYLLFVTLILWFYIMSNDMFVYNKAQQHQGFDCVGQKGQISPLPQRILQPYKARQSAFTVYCPTHMLFRKILNYVAILHNYTNYRWHCLLVCNFPWNVVSLIHHTILWNFSSLFKQETTQWSRVAVLFHALLISSWSATGMQYS